MLSFWWPMSIIKSLVFKQKMQCCLYQMNTFKILFQIVLPFKVQEYMSWNRQNSLFVFCQWTPLFMCGWVIHAHLIHVHTQIDFQWEGQSSYCRLFRHSNSDVGGGNCVSRWVGVKSLLSLRNDWNITCGKHLFFKTQTLWLDSVSFSF